MTGRFALYDKSTFIMSRRRYATEDEVRAAFFDIVAEHGTLFARYIRCVQLMGDELAN